MVTRNEVVAAEFYQRYIQATTEKEITKALRKNTRAARKFLEGIPRKKIDFAYAKDKWTIKQLLQHIIDAERVFCYRALSVARRDVTPLPGFDENNWALAVNSRASERSWKGLLDEFKVLRKSTELLFESFGDEEMLAVGMASDHPVNALGLGFIIAGHLSHHISVIKERYLSC